MIVCSCNVIRDCDLRAAVGRGCKDADAAYRSIGCAFQCGGCRDLAEDIVEQALDAPAAVDKRAA